MILDFITWNVQPEIIEGFHVRWYGLLFAGGFLLAYYVGQSVFKKEGVDQKTLDSMTITAFLGVLIGARLGHCLFYEPSYYLSHPWEIIMVWQGGLASHGAALGIIIGYYIFCKKHKMSWTYVLSRVAITIPLAGAFIRIGNLTNSEIYGHATNLPWGFYFTRSADVVYGREALIPRHPTQIYEALAYFIIFGVMYLYYRSRSAAQQVKSLMLIGMMLAMVFGLRFFVEFLKENQVGFEEHMAINMGQILSLPFVIVGIILMVLSKKEKPWLPEKK